MQQLYMEEEQNELEIDLRELLFIIRRKLWIVILSAVLFGAAALLGTKFLITPQYTSSSSLLVLTKETTLSSLADLQMGSQLTNDYRVLILSRPVLQKVVDNLELEYDYKHLKDKVSISNPSDTRILIISVEDEDPKQACTIVDELAEVSSAYIGDKMEVIPPKIIESGEVDEDPTSPNTLKNTAVGIFLGLVLSIGVIVIIAILDDTIKSEEDIEKYLNVTNLASIPDRKDYINKKSKKAKKSKEK